MKRSRLIIPLIFLIPLASRAQVTSQVQGYQMIIRNNPAYAGVQGNAVLKLSYLDFYPGNHYDISTFYASCDSWFSLLHGGAGLWVSDDYLGGIINETRGGLSYSYFLKAGKDMFINGGLSAAFYHRGYDFSNAVLPDQIDPLGGVMYPSSESLNSAGKTVFDVGAGFVFIMPGMNAGLALNHLSRPDLSTGDFSGGKLDPEISIDVCGEIKAPGRSSFIFRPAGFFSTSGKNFSAGAGGSVENNFISFNVIFSGNNSSNMNIRTGFSVRTGRVRLLYNYCFNVVSGNSAFPFSLFHQLGISVSLNNVDKSKVIKTLTLPEI